MNNEDFERKVEFIVNQQAQFAADIQKLQESQARMHENQALMEKNHLHMEQNQLDMQEAHLRMQEDHARTELSLNQLVQLSTDGFKIVIDNFQHLSAKIDVLVNTQILTDEAVRNLNITLNRHLIEGHSGG